MCSHGDYASYEQNETQAKVKSLSLPKPLVLRGVQPIGKKWSLFFNPSMFSGPSILT